MSLRTPPLRAVHDERGAEFTDFGGWEMPVEFDGIRAEHEAVRESVGKFDVSHMSQIEVIGPDAVALTRRLTTNDVGALGVGDAQYAAITNEEGIILDDTVVYRMPDRDGRPRVLFIPNAGHDEEMAERWRTHRDRWDLDAEVENRTETYAMFAIQGPDAADLVDGAADEPVSDRSRFSAGETAIAGADCWVARTGYTGEDGFEVLAPWEDAEAVWSAFDCQPCGLGARDTLRIEAGFLLSGQDFDPDEEPRTPYEADLGFVVDLDGEFVGRDALARQQAAGVDDRFVGVRLEERGIPRHGYPIESPDGEPIGVVTSGTMSPTLDEPIGLGYVPAEYADPGTEIRVVIRDSPKDATVATKRFIDD